MSFLYGSRENPQVSALKAVLLDLEPSLQIEEVDHETIRVRFPEGPSMVLRGEYFARVVDHPSDLRFYATQIVEKLKKEAR